MIDLLIVFTVNRILDGTIFITWISRKLGILKNLDKSLIIEVSYCKQRAMTINDDGKLNKTIKKLNKFQKELEAL